ncbi:hypothetical protein F4818DRAFT_438284 [Hypoxylon cercidicola]|nr:hypothetical protein F4818DRAFT_438284 [Hypoxylon cercidicola]
MAQGAIKSKKPTATSTARKNKPQQAKKGARVFKAKKGSAADKLQKKYAGGLVAQTEKLLGERAGHLELIGKGRTKNKDGEKGKSTTKGGSRKEESLVGNPFTEFTGRSAVCMLQRVATNYYGYAGGEHGILEDESQLVGGYAKLWFTSHLFIGAEDQKPES